MVPGLPSACAGQVGHLVGADDHGLRKARSHGAGLGQRQAQARARGRFTGARGFVDVGRRHLKRQAQARQQFAAVARGGAKDERAVWGLGMR
jgi:hypothetical protein